jgi:hypothetical protein
MANIHDLFPSRFLQAIDLRGGEPTVTIARVEFEVVGHAAKAETKAVAYFAGQVKGMKLNKTLATTIATIAGTPETDAWGGVTLTLFATSATFGKVAYPVVRVKAAPAASTARVGRPVVDVTLTPVAVPVVAPAPASLAPAGFHAWVDLLRGAAMQDLPTLERAWVSGTKDCRIHLAQTVPGAQAELKAIASRLAGAGRTS